MSRDFSRSIQWSAWFLTGALAVVGGCSSPTDNKDKGSGTSPAVSGSEKPKSPAGTLGTESEQPQPSTLKLEPDGPNAPPPEFEAPAKPVPAQTEGPALEPTAKPAS